VDLELNEVVLQLINMIGVGNFILIIAVMSVIVNMPMIITKIFSIFSSGKKQKETNDYISFIKIKLETFEKDIDFLKDYSTKIKETSNNCSNKLTDISSSLKEYNKERREENMMIVEAIEDMLKSIYSIKNIMKNVMNEDDTIRLVSYLLGVIKNFSNSLLEIILDTVESFKNNENNELNEKALANKMDSCWSNFKDEISRFNTPIKLKPLLDSYDSDFWKKDGMYTQIINTDLSMSIGLLKDTIKKQIDIGLRKLFNEISEKIERNKE
jgi:methyl-accepting chemotaxis protein